MMRVKAACFLLILVAITVRVLWFAIEPIIPLALAGIGLVFVYGFVFKKRL